MPNIKRVKSANISGIASYGALGHMPPSTSSNFIFSSFWNKSDSQLSKYCVVLKFAVSAPRPFQLCPSSQQILATPLANILA